MSDNSFIPAKPSVNLPVDRLHAVRLQKCVCLAERLAAEEPSVCRQWAWMRRFQYEVVRIVQHPFFTLRRAPPQNKHNRPVLSVERHNRRIRKFLPADPPVGVRLVRPDCEHSIQHEYALFCPFRETSVIRDRTAQVIMKLLVNIYKRRGDFHALFHRKTKPVRLSVVVVRILPQNNRFHRMKRS